MQSSYITSAKKANQLPAYEWPEVAFLGRSNCGKSSLLNTLLGRQNLAKSSSTPGRTQMVNFFSVERTRQEKIIFVDLPGYGYNIAQKKVNNLWDELVATYLERPNIKLCLFLSDVRRALDDSEWEYLYSLKQKAPVILVLTKVDKLSQKLLKQVQEDWIQEVKSMGLFLEVIFISNLKNKKGIKELQERVWDITTL